MLKKIGIAMIVVLIGGGVAWAVMANSGGHHTASMGDKDASRHGQMAPGDVTFDQQFIDDMVPHHEMAVDMAKIVLERGKRPELQEMARTIIAAQTVEVTQMRDWRQEWFGSSKTPAEPSHEMPGMDIAAVEGATDVDRAFLDEMILHHQSAVEMATEAKTQGTYQEIRDLAGRIVSAQQVEIGQMETWRKAWYGEAAN